MASNWITEAKKQLIKTSSPDGAKPLAVSAPEPSDVHTDKKKAIKTTVEIPVDLYRRMHALIAEAKTTGASINLSGQAVIVTALSAYLDANSV